MTDDEKTFSQYVDAYDVIRREKLMAIKRAAKSRARGYLEELEDGPTWPGDGESGPSISRRMTVPGRVFK